MRQIRRKGQKRWWSVLISLSGREYSDSINATLMYEVSEYKKTDRVSDLPGCSTGGTIPIKRLPAPIHPNIGGLFILSNQFLSLDPVPSNCGGKNCP